MIETAYWGPFAEVRQKPGLRIRDSVPYSGLMAEAMSNLLDMGVADTKGSELDDYVALARRFGDPVLELGCGAGRVLLELAREGRTIVGVDRSADMLTILRRRILELPEVIQARVTLVQADICALALGTEFSLILLPFYTIFLFPEREQRLALMRTIAKHLAPDGVFAFDFVGINPQDVRALVEHIVKMNVTVAGDAVPSYLGMKLSPSGDRILVNLYCQIATEEGLEHCFQSQSMALVDIDELNGLFDESGLVLTQTVSEPLIGGRAERTLVCAGRRTGTRYPLWHPYTPMNLLPENVLTLVSGEGSRVRTADGSEYIDASGGLWSTQCGLGHPAIIEAIGRQLKRLSYGTLFASRGNEPAVALARDLVALAPSPLQWVYLTGSGSESVELAIKLARLHFTADGAARRNRIAYLDESYHGTFFGSMGVSGLYLDKEALGPLLPGVVPVTTPSPSRCPAGVEYERFALDCASELERLIESADGQIAAFIIEPVLGSAGVVVPPEAYLKAVERTCREHGVLLILDEVATGFGRTGRWFAAEHYGLRPDMMLLSKGITSGYLPLGAVLFSAEIGASLIARGAAIGHGSSHNGNPVCCAAALETIAVLRRERLVERSAEIGAYFRAGLDRLREHDCVADVRSVGLMLGIELRGDDAGARPVENVARSYSDLQRNGVLAYPAPRGLVFFPPLVITEQEVDTVIDTTHQALSRLPQPVH